LAKKSKKKIDIRVPKVRQRRIGQLLEELKMGVSWLEKEVELSGISCCG
jgi:hypothetical protein